MASHFPSEPTRPAAAAKLLQSCPTLCNPTDGSPPGSTVPGILQARILEWVAISFSRAWKWKVKVKSFSHVWPLATPWTTAYQAPLSMGFSRQEYWSGVPLPSPPQGLAMLYLCKMLSVLSISPLEFELTGDDFSIIDKTSTVHSLQWTVTAKVKSDPCFDSTISLIKWGGGNNDL